MKVIFDNYTKVSSLRLNVIWKNNSISFRVNLKLLKSPVVYILLYGCGSWTLTATEDPCASHTQSTGRLSSSDMSPTTLAAGTTHCQGQATETGLAWYISSQDSLAKIILQGTVEGK